MNSLFGERGLFCQGLVVEASAKRQGVVGGGGETSLWLHTWEQGRGCGSQGSG